MTIEEMNEIKEARGYSFSQLSEYSGVPMVTLQRILSGKTANPRKVTLDAIEKVLTGDESLYSGKAYSYGERSSVSYYEVEDSSQGVAESEFVYGSKKNGAYTIDDYYALPGDKWVELIEGSLYEMRTPDPLHQMIIGEVACSIYNYIKENKKTHILFTLPMNVQLGSDDNTIVQPDIFIVSDSDKIHDRGIYGAPDFVLEVLTPSTRKKDMFLKSRKYWDAGVKEYWIIDPKNKILLSYTFMEEDVNTVSVPLEGEYPLALYEGELKINLDAIAQLIKRFG